jgi:threonine-phosphate decarboxylase
MSKMVQPWNVSVLAQAAGVAALHEKQFLIKTKAMIPVERRWLKDELEALGFWVCPSQTNYLLFCGNAGLHKALKKHGIAIRNCENYHGLSPGWYRIAVRLHEQNEQLISAIKLVCGKG